VPARTKTSARGELRLLDSVPAPPDAAPAPAPPLTSSCPAAPPADFSHLGPIPGGRGLPPARAPAPSREALRARPTPAQRAAAAAALAAPDDTVLLRAWRANITAKPLRVLRDGEWLNDDVINAFILLLRERVALTGGSRFIFNTFFWTTLTQDTRGPPPPGGGLGPVTDAGYRYAGVRTWTNVGARTRPRGVPIDVFAYDEVLVPINYVRSHWALAGINLHTKTITYYDSLGGGRPAPDVFTRLLRWVGDEWRDKGKPGPFDGEGWTFAGGPPGLPRQNNGVDCGVFVCAALDFLSAGYTPVAPADYAQGDIPDRRVRVLAAILEQRAPGVDAAALKEAGMGNECAGCLT